MSLDAAQRKQTSAELLANLRLSGLTSADLAADLGLNRAEVEGALHVSTSRPELVWLLRDHLEAAVRARGEEPHAYTVLTEQMRAAASRWFPLRGTS